MYATQAPKVASSLLPNGVRIHSLGNVDSNSKPCVVNVCVHAGSRFESENSAGSSAFLERAFYMVPLFYAYLFPTQHNNIARAPMPIVAIMF